MPRPERSLKSYREFLIQISSRKWPRLIARFDLKPDMPSLSSQWRIRMTLFAAFHCIICCFPVSLSWSSSIEGLKLSGMLDLIRQHPKKARHLFMPSSENRVTAEKLDALFDCIFSPEGSNKRAQEEAVALNFSLYLDAVEANEAKSNLLDLTTGEETEITLSLSDVLQFITGSFTVPATGFNEKPLIEFEHGDPHRKLHANTCSNTITFPVNSTLMEFESFKNEFTSCLVMSPGFGTI